jgi:ribose-phosphate pyrophosphokinase
MATEGSRLEVVTKKRMQVFAGRSHPELAEEVVAHLGMRLGEVDIHDFSNGELYCRFRENVRGSDVFVIQTHCSPVNTNIFEQLIMIDALKRASAKRIIAVVPFYGYARQDRKAQGREPITAKLVADMLSVAGADRMVSVNLHTGQIQGFFDVPVDHLTALPLLLGWLREELADEDEIVVASPDAGGSRYAEKFRNRLRNASSAFLAKTRTAHNVAKTLAVVGEVEGRTCVLVDDMIDTAGTICGAGDALMARGAKRVIALATHPVLSGDACKRLNDSCIEKLVVTNTLPLPGHCHLDRIEVLSVAPLVASTIKAVFEDESVSELFDQDNI